MYSDQELLDEIQRLADGDTPPTQQEMNDNGRFHATTHESRFGSWNKALQAAGFSVNRKSDITEHELLGEIRSLAHGDTPPTQQEAAEHSRFAVTTYRNRFDSWNKALQAAGFSPNQIVNISDRELLQELRCHADGNLAPQLQQNKEMKKFSAEPYRRKIGSIWQASVRAGLTPRSRRPLTDQQFNDFFDAAINRTKPTQQLVAHLFQFTGLPPRTVCELTDDWITKQPTGRLVTVPSEFTESGSEWVFKLPKTFDDEQKTNLPGLIDWYFDQHKSIQYEWSASCRQTVYRVAKDASLDRRTIETSIGPAPEVRPSDLRATGGVRMVRNNAPARRIRRHLGLEHTNWDATVEDFFLYAYVHYDHEHPDYDPPDVVLDPVSP